MSDEPEYDDTRLLILDQPVFRLMTPEELAAPSMFDEYLYPNPKKYRWHCSVCGRWVPFAGIRSVPPIPGEPDEHEYTGVCKTHGRVDVSWPQ